jgi:transcriptional regulator with PAS, ATPase and Fis domain
VLQEAFVPRGGARRPPAAPRLPAEPLPGPAVGPGVARDRGPGPVAIVGNDETFTGVLGIVERVADTDASIVLRGETGTGKEVVARAIHYASKRRDKPFVAVNCAALPEGLLESELFGHVKGAFTGATQARRGRFAMAEGGTLFLDEIGDMPMVLQVKLLRVIQERQYEVLGDSRTTPTNVRFIAATHRNLEQLITEGTFREDLYYRLNVVDLHLPPLRERASDISLLLTHFISEANVAHSRGVSGVTPQALELLRAYQWPGNVRELSNVVERMVVLRGSGVIDVGDVPLLVRKQQAGPGGGAGVPPALPTAGLDLGEELQRFEGVLIDQALQRTRGNRTQAAALLRINRTTLVEKLKRKGAGEAETDE